MDTHFAANPFADMPSNPKDDRGPLVAGVGGTFLGLIWLSMSLRFYVRKFLQMQLGWDDYLMLLASLLFSALAGMIFWGVKMGMGKHILDLQPAHISKTILAWYISEIIYAFCITLVKVSIGIFLLRIAVKRNHRIILIFVTTANAALGIILLGFVVFQCAPISYFWTRPLNDGRQGHCRNTVGPIDLIYVQSAVSVCIDLTYAILPVFIIWNLQMPRRTKFLVAGILGMGTIGSAALLVRLPYLAHLGDNLDYLYNTTNVAIWSVVEPGMGIVAGSLATLRPLLLALQGRRRKAGEGARLTERRTYESRRLGSDERVFDANGSGGGRDVYTPTEDHISLEKLDLEGRGDMPTVTTIIAVGEGTRWNATFVSKAADKEGDMEEEGASSKGTTRTGGVEVRTEVRQISSEAPVREGSSEGKRSSSDAAARSSLEAVTEGKEGPSP